MQVTHAGTSRVIGLSRFQIPASVVMSHNVGGSVCQLIEPVEPPGSYLVGASRCTPGPAHSDSHARTAGHAGHASCVRLQHASLVSHLYTGRHAQYIFYYLIFLHIQPIFKCFVQARDICFFGWRFVSYGKRTFDHNNEM